MEETQNLRDFSVSSFYTGQLTRWAISRKTELLLSTQQRSINYVPKLYSICPPDNAVKPLCVYMCTLLC